MSKRNIITINDEKCNGCGLCIPNCPEGAIQIIDGKARLVSDLFCDGLGACLGHCPQGAIILEERDAQAYDEGKVMENILRQGTDVIKAHLAHLKAHGAHNLLMQAKDFLKKRNIEIDFGEDSSAGKAHLHNGGTCPGAKVIDFRKTQTPKPQEDLSLVQDSELRQWPVQLMLVHPSAPYLNNAHLLIAADCVHFAYAGFHEDLLKDKILLVGCPKFDNLVHYEEKLTHIFKDNEIKSVTYAHMEVPCCLGLIPTIKAAILHSGKEIPFKDAVIGIKGERLK